MRYLGMKRVVAVVFIVLLLVTNTVPAQSGWLNDQFKSFKDKGLDSVTTKTLSDTKIADGLKEALKVGIDNAVNLTGQTDGYLKNEDIKIKLPGNLQFADKALRVVGFGDKLDEFVLSMNRAAEQAAPFARDIFLNALFEMSFDDARKIFEGGDTAATGFFKDKTYDQLEQAFQPVVEKALAQYEVTDRYNAIISKYQSIPFASNLEDLDADSYVISRALDGLFLVLGQQETKIRNEPAARVTGLLKEVFK